MILLYFISAIVCGASKYVADTVNFRFELSYFSRLNHKFWNPKISWRNKWKNGYNYDGEKFLFSSTLLVFLTDAWHLFTTLQYIIIFLSTTILIYYDLNLMCLFFWWVIYLGSFEVLFRNY